MTSELQSVSEQLRSIGADAAASARECDAAARRASQHIRQAIAVVGSPVPQGFRGYIATVEQASQALAKSAFALEAVRGRGDSYAVELSLIAATRGDSHGDKGGHRQTESSSETPTAWNRGSVSAPSPLPGDHPKDTQPKHYKPAPNTARVALTLDWLRGFSHQTQLSPPDAWVKRINPDGKTGKGRQQNCEDCTRAVALTIEGQPTVACAMPKGAGAASNMPKWTHVPQVPTTPAALQAKLIGMEVGSYAIVGVDWKDGGGHWFIAYRGPSGVQYVDGQTGEVSGWPPPFADDVAVWDAAVRQRSKTLWSWS